MGAFTVWPPWSVLILLTVSILVFLEWALSLFTPCSIHCLILRVSILVFLEWALSPNFILVLSADGFLVSILVFLEWALSQKKSPLIDSRLYSFNPCFLGMGAFTYPGSKLFDFIARKFQSLFSWNGRFHMLIQKCWEIGNCCFNPCFLGMGAFTCQGRRRKSHLRMFQSLFSWNGRFHASCQAQWKKHWKEFQSLFSWNGRFHIN